MRNGRVETSNLPWVIEQSRLAKQIHLPATLLINDLEASAWGIGALETTDLVALNEVDGPAIGNQAVIAPGTGLGEAGLFWDGTRHHVFACEGGHADFAPTDDLQIELLRFLKARFGHVSYERVLSGPGLVNVYEFLRDTGCGKESDEFAAILQNTDPAAAISRAALDGTQPLAVKALDIWITVYGAEASNLALKTMATGGLFLAGGISPKILAKMTGPLFMQSFLEKGRLRPLVESIPVQVVTNEKKRDYWAPPAAPPSAAKADSWKEPVLVSYDALRAAKRRKIATAHRASRGWRAESRQAPEGRKKLTTTVRE